MMPCGVHDKQARHAVSFHRRKSARADTSRTLWYTRGADSRLLATCTARGNWNLGAKHMQPRPEHDGLPGYAPAAEMARFILSAHLEMVIAHQNAALRYWPSCATSRGIKVWRRPTGPAIRQRRHTVMRPSVGLLSTLRLDVAVPSNKG